MASSPYIRPSRDAALDLARASDLRQLMEQAAALRDAGFGQAVTYSRKVFIPLTQLCRDVCHYCTFAQPPRPGERAYLTLDEAVDVARRGAEQGCREALFTLGDRPELRYPQARAELTELGYPTTISYLVAAARAVFDATGLLPHANPGVLTRGELTALREVCPSQGLMLESASRRLLEPGQVHHGSPDKDPDARLATMQMAGELAIPYTSGILIGIGETREERIASLLALRDLHDE
jgi:FO synthase